MSTLEQGGDDGGRRVGAVERASDRVSEDGIATERTFLEMQQSEDFQRLRRLLRGFAFPATAVFLAWYLLYVLMSAYARDFMGQKVLGNINVAYLFGLLQFVSTFLIAYLYSRFADSKLDPLATQIRDEIERRP